MKLSSLHIERFGARSNLQLENLSERLNLVYGPNGSGKTTIINFIRWMLYGGQDEVSRRYLTTGEGPVGGVLRVVDGRQQRLAVTRHHDALHPDQVRVAGEDRDPALGLDPHRLTGVSLPEYRQIFCFGFDQQPALEQLIQAPLGRDITLAHDERQLHRVREVTERLDALRRTYQGYSSEESFPGLLERRRQLQVELDQVERRRAERVRQLQAESDQLAAEINEDRRQVNELEAVVRRTESNIEVRRRQLEDAARVAWQTRDRWQDERRQEVADLDYQLQQWHTVLEAIRQRHERLQAARAHWEPQSSLSPMSDEADLRVFLRSLGYQIDDIDHDLRDLEVGEGVASDRVRGDYLRSVFAAALQSMRDDVQRLVRELRRQQASSKYHDEAREQDHLRRCEAELTSLIDSLNQRRQTLLLQPEYSDVDWAPASSLTSPQEWPTTSTTLRSWHDPRGESYLGGLTGAGGLNGTAQSFYRPALTDPVLEARLSHLVKRRDYLVARLRELESELAAAEHRLEVLQGNRNFLDEERQLETLRRELESIDQRMRQAEERQRRRDEIESLERQLEELRRTLGPSEILREAAAILQRLTDGAHRELRINDRREVWVEDSRGQFLPDAELSRGTRDQVYLSLALAIVAAYRRRGIELPMVLNDVFLNIDTERAPATAEVLAQFAAQGHQVLLFTRHEHILQRFGQLNAKLYTLRERTQWVEPTRPAAATRREAAVRSDAYYLDQAPIVPVVPLWEPPPTSRVPLAEAAEPLRRERNYDWVAQWDTPRRPVPARGAGETTGEPVLGILSEQTLLGDIESLNKPQMLRLRDLGIHTVLQLLELEPEEGERHLSALGVTAAAIFRWQSELALQCYVGLSASDAALLVACGVDDPEELSYIDVSELHRRIEQFLAASDSRNRYGSIARFERPRLSRWIQAARRSHYRRSRQRWARFRNGQRPNQPVVTQRPEIIVRPEVLSERLATRPRRVEPRAPEPRGPEPRAPEPRAAESRVDDTLRAKRAPARERTAPRREPAMDERPTAERPSTERTTAERTPAERMPAERGAGERAETLRFYLEPTDPIVDAPSIGPKTAERFHAIGVTNVAQLLELDAVEAAGRINYRRLTADMIRSWQIQTLLVCRVPNLRGHDAQVLEACQIPSPEHLAKMDPQALLVEVERFANSAEGKRVLRSAKAPDQAQVTAWIRWAQKARPRG